MDKFVIFHIDGGAGKSVAATAVCTSIKKAYPDHKLVVVSAWPEVFLHNPEIYRIYKMGNHAYFYEDYIKNKDSIILRSEPYHAEDFIHRKKHLIEIWCDIFKIPCISKQPRLFLTQRELIHANKVLNKQTKILTLQTNGGGDEKETYSWARDLPIPFAQKIVNSSLETYGKVLHVRKEGQPALEKTIQVTDNLRNLFCYVYLSDKLVLIDSLIQHVAAAFNKQAAVAWIANSPVVFGYDCHLNITPTLQPSFRHSIDSYMDEVDWVGRRHFECPYDDVDNIFSMESFTSYLNDNELTFDKMPKKIIKK